MQLLLVLLLFQAQPTLAQYPVVLPYYRLGAYDTTSAGWQAATNPAALAGIHHGSFAFYGEQRFLLAAVSGYQASLILPAPPGAWAFGGTYSGSAAYNRAGLSVGYGRPVGKNMALGLQFYYVQQHSQGYRIERNLEWEIGTTLRVSPQVVVALDAVNPSGTLLSGKASSQRPAGYSFGIQYTAARQLVLLLECGKGEDQPASLHAGLLYAFDEKLHAGGGVVSATASLYLGGGFQWKDCFIDAVFSFHPRLGLTPGLLITYRRP